MKMWQIWPQTFWIQPNYVICILIKILFFQYTNILIYLYIYILGFIFFWNFIKKNSWQQFSQFLHRHRKIHYFCPFSALASSNFNKTSTCFRLLTAVGRDPFPWVFGGMDFWRLNGWLHRWLDMIEYTKMSCHHFKNFLKKTDIFFLFCHRWFDWNSWL